MNKLLKVKTRGFSEFYFTDDENQDIHDFDGKSDNLDYEYGARVVEEYNFEGKDNIYIVEIKNKLSIGDSLEILYSNSINVDKFKIEELYDEKTNEPIDTINPGKKGQLVKIKIPYNVDYGTILRRKK